MVLLPQTTDLIDQCEHILEEGYQKLTKLNNLLRKPQNDSEDVPSRHVSFPHIFSFFPLHFPHMYSKYKKMQ